MISTDVGEVDFPTLGDIGDAWITRHCRVPDGFARGKPYVKADWQFWVHANRYRIREDATYVDPAVVAEMLEAIAGGSAEAERITNEDLPALNQAFTYRRTLTVGPQKTGKGPNSATEVAYEGVGPSVFAGFAEGGEVYECEAFGCSCGWTYEYEPGQPMGMRHPSPLIQITATSEDQTDNIFRPLRAMIRLGPLKELLAVREGFIRILGRSSDEDADDLDRIDAVTASANARLGNPISDAEQDEAGLYTKSNKLIGVANTQNRGAAGMGGRTHITTNAWDPTENSYAQQQFESGSEDLFVFYRDPALVPELCDPTTGRPLSFTSKANRRKIFQYVYEGSWWVNLDSIEAECADLMKTDPAQAERFFGNRRVQGGGSWLAEGIWDALYAGAGHAR